MRSQHGYTDLHFMMALVVITVVLTACALRHIKGPEHPDEQKQEERSSEEQTATSGWGPKNTRWTDPAYEHSAENQLSAFNLKYWSDGSKSK